MRGLAFLLMVPMFQGVAPMVPDQKADVTEVAEANNQFAFDLYGALRERSGNLFLSPYSLSTALTMTSAGARGETAAQMALVLHDTQPSDRLHAGQAAMADMLGGDGRERPYQLSVANRLWGQQGYHFLPDFLALTRSAYGAELASLNFADTEAARLEINAWVEGQTQDRITDLIAPGVLDPMTRLVLTNAIYFKGPWAEPFREAATRDEPFFLTADTSVPAPLMRKRAGFRYASGDGLKVLELPYQSGELSMVVLLPEAVDGLADLERRLDAENLARWLAGLRKQEVDVFLPRFTMTSQFSMAEVLKSLGMILAFDRDRADFSGITSQEALFIWAVVHKAFVEVNEEGTEAAAATAVVMEARSALVPREPAVFRADHPFLFLIRHNSTGAILFLGRLNDPLH